VIVEDDVAGAGLFHIGHKFTLPGLMLIHLVNQGRKISVPRGTELLRVKIDLGL
jgi:hypothetical protein